MSENEIMVLNKGLTFVPHNIPLTYKDRDDDVKRLERKLQTIEKSVTKLLRMKILNPTKTTPD